MEKLKTRLKNIVKYLIITIILIGCSYQQKIINSNNYKMAFEEMSQHNERKDLKLLGKKELLEHAIFIFGNDTVKFKPDENSFGFRNLKTGNLTLYKFHPEVGIYTKIKCNEKWQVVQMTPVAEAY